MPREKEIVVQDFVSAAANKPVSNEIASGRAFLVRTLSLLGLPNESGYRPYL